MTLPGEVKISSAFSKLPDGFDYTYHVRQDQYNRDDDGVMLIFALGFRYIRECQALGLGPVEQITKLMEKMPELIPTEDLPLGAEVRAEADREIEAEYQADQDEMKYLDSLDTMGGMPPNAPERQLEEREE